MSANKSENGDSRGSRANSHTINFGAQSDGRGLSAEKPARMLRCRRVVQSEADPSFLEGIVVLFLCENPDLTLTVEACQAGSTLRCPRVTCVLPILLTRVLYLRTLIYPTVPLC